MSEERTFTIRNASFGFNRRDRRALTALLRHPTRSKAKRAEIRKLQTLAADAAAARLRALEAQ